MSTDPSRPDHCARCNRPLGRKHQFCPECGLPATGAVVLSSEIRTLGEQTRRPRGERPFWKRAVVRGGALGMIGFVLFLGMLLFNRQLIEQVFPPAEADVSSSLEMAPSWEPEWVRIPAGTFHRGPRLRPLDEALEIGRPADPDFFIEKYLITNGDWLAFLTAEEESLRAQGLWIGNAFPKQASGWHVTEDGRPEPPRSPRTGRPLIEDLVEHVTLDAIRRYIAWNHARPEYHVRRLSITNQRWSEFLADERERLAETNEAVSPDLMPSAGSGWTLDPDGRPIPEPGTESALVTGVSLDAVQRFYDWSTRYTIPYDFEISKYEIPNVLWRDFLEAEEEQLREEGLWEDVLPKADARWYRDEDGRLTPEPQELNRPVRFVSRTAVHRFTAWLTRRLRDPDYEIRMPTPAEWEYAARGHDRRRYPWGDWFLGDPAPQTGEPKLRSSFHRNNPTQARAVEEDESYFGVVGMGSNVAEWVYDLKTSVGEIRGSSFRDLGPQARHDAQVWENQRRFAPFFSFAHVGIRLVKVRRGSE